MYAANHFVQFKWKRMKEVLLTLLFEDDWIQTFGLRYCCTFFFFNCVPWKQNKFWGFSFTFFRKALFFKGKSSWGTGSACAQLPVVLQGQRSSSAGEPREQGWLWPHPHCACGIPLQSLLEQEARGRVLRWVKAFAHGRDASWAATCLCGGTDASAGSEHQ